MVKILQYEQGKCSILMKFISGEIFMSDDVPLVITKKMLKIVMIPV